MKMFRFGFLVIRFFATWWSCLLGMRRSREMRRNCFKKSTFFSKTFCFLQNFVQLTYLSLKRAKFGQKVIGDILHFRLMKVLLWKWTLGVTRSVGCLRLQSINHEIDCILKSGKQSSSFVLENTVISGKIFLRAPWTRINYLVSKIVDVVWGWCAHTHTFIKQGFVVLTCLVMCCSTVYSQLSVLSVVAR